MPEGSGILGEFERFVKSDEGSKWLGSRGWVRTSSIFEKALIVPVDSEDILEDALVMVISCGEKRKEPRAWELPERGVLGKIAIFTENEERGHEAAG